MLNSKLDNSYIIGKYGPVIKCIEEDSNGKEEIKFKSVKKNFDVKMLENGNYNLNDVPRLLNKSLLSIFNEIKIMFLKFLLYFLFIPEIFLLQLYTK